MHVAARDMAGEQRHRQHHRERQDADCKIDLRHDDRIAPGAVERQRIDRQRDAPRDRLEAADGGEGANGGFVRGLGHRQARSREIRCMNAWGKRGSSIRDSGPQASREAAGRLPDDPNTQRQQGIVPVMRRSRNAQCGTSTSRIDPSFRCPRQGRYGNKSRPPRAMPGRRTLVRWTRAARRNSMLDQTGRKSAMPNPHFADWE
jgi:hypothetical protein